MSREPDAQQGRLTSTARTIFTPQVGVVALLKDVAKWALLAVFGIPLALAIGPWVGRTAATLGPEGLGIVAVVIVVMWAGNRALKKILLPAPTQAAPMARGVPLQPDELANMLGPVEAKAAHEAGHAAACLALGLEMVDVTLKQVEITADANRRTQALPDQAWKRLVMVMAGRAGQERIGNHTLASDQDNEQALRIATRLHEHRAELPVDYDSPANLVELARTAARQVLDDNATAFDAIREALVDRGHLTADDLTAVVDDAHAERRP